MFEMSLMIKILGLVLIFLGVVLIVNPELVSQKSIPDTIFKAVERRIKWGVILGIGLLLVFQAHFSPWLLLLSASCFYLTLGVLIARLIGIMLDGSVRMQWVWVAVELIVLLALGYWYAYMSDFNVLM